MPHWLFLGIICNGDGKPKKLKETKNMEYIYETVVFNGATKEWRILNINTGTFYSMEFQTFDSAKNSIEEGQKRGDKTVKYISLEEILNRLV